MIKNAVFTQRIKHTITTLIAISLLSGCGFKLRGNYLLPEEFKTMYVSSVNKHDELTRMVKQHLKINEINLVTTGNVTTPELRILNDSLDRRTLSLFENGQVAEYELTYTVRYEIRFSNNKAQYFQFELNRNYQDNPDKALAKSRELTLLRSEMRSEAAKKILRNLASIQL